MRWRREGYGGANLAQTILDKGDLFKRRPVKWLGGGASAGRHGYFWEGVVPGGVCVSVRGNEEMNGTHFLGTI
jgi:hypothetical protein